MFVWTQCNLIVPFNRSILIQYIVKCSLSLLNAMATIQWRKTYVGMLQAMAQRELRKQNERKDHRWKRKKNTMENFLLFAPLALLVHLIDVWALVVKVGANEEGENTQRPKLSSLHIPSQLHVWEQPSQHTYLYIIYTWNNWVTSWESIIRCLWCYPPGPHSW